MVTPVDLSGIEFFLPIISFLLVFIVCYFLIVASKIISNNYVAAATSFLVATVFVSATGPRNYILAIVPWFAVLLIGLFLFMVLGGFLSKDDKAIFPTKIVFRIFVILLGAIFVITAFFVFSTYFSPYLPGANTSGGNSDVLRFVNWIYSPRVAGGLLLLGVSLVVAWFLVKNTK